MRYTAHCSALLHISLKLVSLAEYPLRFEHQSNRQYLQVQLPLTVWGMYSCRSCQHLL